MTKRIKGKTKTGELLWIIVPNLVVKSFTEKDDLTLLDVFYFFAQILTDPKKKRLSKEEEKRIKATKKRILIELDNKIIQFFQKNPQTNSWKKSRWPCYPCRDTHGNRGWLPRLFLKWERPSWSF